MHLEDGLAVGRTKKIRITTSLVGPIYFDMKPSKLMKIHMHNEKEPLSLPLPQFKTTL